MFIFIVGLTLTRNFNSRQKELGTMRVYLFMSLRFFAIMGAGGALAGVKRGWVEIFAGNTTFDKLGLSAQIFAVSTWIAIAMVLAVFVINFTRNQKLKDISWFVLRYFLDFMGFLSLFFIVEITASQLDSSVEVSKYGTLVWDTLQNIGLAGLLALIFVQFSSRGKLVVVTIVFILMTAFMQNGGFAIANTFLEGGLYGAFSWGCIVLLGSVFADLRGAKRFILLAILLLIPIIFVLIFNFYAVKRGCTPMFAMFSSAICALIFIGFDALNNFNPKFTLLTWWGRNSIVTYFACYILVSIVGAILMVTKVTLPIWAGLLVVVACVVLLSVMNWLLSRFKIYIKL